MTDWFLRYFLGPHICCYIFRMTDFKQLHIERSIDDGQALTDDDLYWSPLSNSHPTTLREYGPVTRIDIAPIRQQWISITDSTRVQIYSPDTLSLVRSFYSFKDTAYCGTFRSGSIQTRVVFGGLEPLLLLFFSSFFRWSPRLCWIQRWNRPCFRFRDSDATASFQRTSRLTCALYTFLPR